MKILKKIIDFYINSSIHVALSCYALVILTQIMFNIPTVGAVANFAFFGTIVAYNFVKYDALARNLNFVFRTELKAIAILSLLSFFASLLYFFQLNIITRLLGIGFLLLTLLYTLPFFPNKKNARNWAGIKIYIVSLCWVGITVILPIIDAGIEINFDFYLKCFQRFLLIFVLILIFEIIDLQNDDPHLQTVPQQIGVKCTKIVGLLVLVLFYILELFKINFMKEQLVTNFILILTVAIFLIFSNQRKSKYYTSFWVESIPVFWLVLCFILIKMF